MAQVEDKHAVAVVAAGTYGVGDTSLLVSVGPSRRVAYVRTTVVVGGTV